MKRPSLQPRTQAKQHSQRAAPLALALSARRLDVLVEPEEIRGIVLVLHGHQPRILDWAVGRFDPVHVVLRLVIDIQAA